MVVAWPKWEERKGRRRKRGGKKRRGEGFNNPFRHAMPQLIMSIVLRRCSLMSTVTLSTHEGSHTCTSAVALRHRHHDPPRAMVLSHITGQEKGKREKGREGKLWGNEGVGLGGF